MQYIRAGCAPDQGLSKRRLCTEYVGRKVNNVSGLICAEILPLHVLSLSPPELKPGMSPRSNRKLSTWSAVNLEKKHDLDSS